MLELSAEMAQDSEQADHPAVGWTVPIVPTVGPSGDGVSELWDAVLAHRTYAGDSGLLERRRRFRLGEELREIIARRLEQRARDVCSGERWDELTDQVLSRQVDPWAAADEMLTPVLD
jgi:LAO/AO transport system kinase